MSVALGQSTTERERLKGCLPARGQRNSATHLWSPRPLLGCSCWDEVAFYLLLLWENWIDPIELLLFKRKIGAAPTESSVFLQPFFGADVPVTVSRFPCYFPLFPSPLTHAHRCKRGTHMQRGWSTVSTHCLQRRPNVDCLRNRIPESSWQANNHEDERGDGCARSAPAHSKVHPHRSYQRNCQTDGIYALRLLLTGIDFLVTVFLFICV